MWMTALEGVEQAILQHGVTAPAAATWVSAVFSTMVYEKQSFLQRTAK